MTLRPGDQVQYLRAACAELGGETRRRAENARGIVVSLDDTRVRVVWDNGKRDGWIDQKFLEHATGSESHALVC